MSKKGLGIALCVLAGVLTIIAINNTFISPKIPVGDKSGLGVSQMVGSFCQPWSHWCSLYVYFKALPKNNSLSCWGAVVEVSIVGSLPLP